MNARKLALRMGLSEANLTAIRESVTAAEKSTTGEIALAAIPESSDYSFFELLASVILSAAAFAALLVFHGKLELILDRMFWHVPSWYLPAATGFVTFAVIGIFFAVANIPAIDRIVIPRTVRKRAVYIRALRAFLESGAYATKDRTGILVFVSYMEREVRIIADSGISGKIDQAEWDRIALGVAAGIREGKTAAALTDAIARCGELLAAHFPASGENPNELADGLILLEAGA